MPKAKETIWLEIARLKDAQRDLHLTMNKIFSFFGWASIFLGILAILISLSLRPSLRLSWFVLLSLLLLLVYLYSFLSFADLHRAYQNKTRLIRVRYNQLASTGKS